RGRRRRRLRARLGGGRRRRGGLRRRRRGSRRGLGRRLLVGVRVLRGGLRQLDRFARAGKGRGRQGRDHNEGTAAEQKCRDVARDEARGHGAGRLLEAALTLDWNVVISRAHGSGAFQSTQSFFTRGDFLNGCLAYCSAILRTRARALPLASAITRNVFESNSMPTRRSPSTAASTSTPSTGFSKSASEASMLFLALAANGLRSTTAFCASAFCR